MGGSEGMTNLDPFTLGVALFVVVSSGLNVVLALYCMKLEGRIRVKLQIKRTRSRKK